MIETRVPGDPASIRAAAGWLRTSLGGGLRDAGNHTAEARSVALGHWDGQAADAYRGAAGRVLAATDDHAERVLRAATRLEEYAARLSAVIEHLAGVRGRAAAGGLTVAGTVIEPPPAVPAIVVSPGSPEEEAHRAGLARIALYDQLAAEARDEWDRFVQYSDSHLAAAVADAEGGEDVAVLGDVLSDVLDSALPGMGIGLAGVSMRNLSDDYRARAAELRRRSRVAGNPRVRGQADTPAGRATLDDLMRGSRFWSDAGRLMGPAGVALDVYSGYQEGQETGDWTRATLTTGASIGAGAAVGAAAAAGIIVAPAAVVVVVGGVAAWGAAEGVGWIYDHREEIADWAGDRVDAAQELADDTWEGAKDVASDVWGAVTPW